MSNKRITVIVCTYNRSNLLKICLDSLLAQSIDSSLYDIIVIDNLSKDDTQEVLKDYQDKNKFIKAFIETEIGLGVARNRGLKESDTEYVAYIDDDAKADKDWLKNALKIIDEIKPDIFGGPIYPYYIGEKVNWFKNEYGQYSCYENSGFIGQGKYLSGSNIFFKTRLLNDYGGFNVDLGMKGSELGYHEESAIQNRAYSENKKVYYSLDLKVFHIVSEMKQNIIGFLYTNYKSGKDGIKVWKNSLQVKDFFRLIENIEGLMKELNNSIFNRDRERYEFPENYVYENLHGKLFEMGYLASGLSTLNSVPNSSFIEYLVKERKISFSELIELYEVYSDGVNLSDVSDLIVKRNKKLTKKDLVAIDSLLKKQKNFTLSKIKHFIKKYIKI